MSEHVLPPLLTEERVRYMRDRAIEHRDAGYTNAENEATVALCDAWLARGVTGEDYEGEINWLCDIQKRYEMPPDDRQFALSTIRALASRKPREGLVVDGAPYNRDISPADVPSAGEK